MKKREDSFLSLEFKYRIFVSLSIVAITCLISFGLFPESAPLYSQVLKETSAGNISADTAYITAAFIMVLVSLLRMWSGSILSSEIVMKFRVRTDKLSKDGPYQLVRNPIYLADWIAIFVFSLFLPPIGIIMPVLFYIHYVRLIAYEENSLLKEYKDDYIDYINNVPRLLPGIRSIYRFISELKNFNINYDGFRHNATYVLFIPGFIAAAYGNSFIYAIIIGLPGVIDWAVIHTEIGVEKERGKKKKVFEGILYAQCWEDPQIDRAAFNMNSKDIVFTITSGGCNALTFLLDNPSKIIALDMNPHQNYLLELKMAAMKRLSYDEVLQLLGIRDSSDRMKLYTDSRALLSNAAQDFWDNHTKEIKKGLIHSGRYERYMGLLRGVLIVLIGRKTINKIFDAQSSEERKIIYNKKWDNLRWKLFTRVLLSRTIMSLLFTKEFFSYLNDKISFGDNFAQKVRKAVTELPVKENYFLTYILYGNYNQQHLPPYLQRDNYEKILSRLNRIKIVTGSCENYFKSLPDSAISRFNFTNIFEWVSTEEFENLLRDTIRVAKDKSVITYRNLLVRREHPYVLDKNIESGNELANRLHNIDMSFIYDRYVVEIIFKKETSCFTEPLKYQQKKTSESLSNYRSEYIPVTPTGYRR
jgi:S-adenosylmethionine-diacylglycerol 3-amino-3-carboxypropyl transferase